MAQGNEQATFSVNLSGNAADAATTAADAMEALRKRIQAGQGALKEMQGNLRNLRGASEEVRSAKDELKAKLDAERNAVSQATLQLLKQGKAYEALGADAKKLAADRTRLADRTKAESAGVKELSASLKASDTKATVASSEALAASFASATVAAVALAAAVGAAFVSLGKFALRGADAARSAALLREAAMGGNAQWGKNFGEQIDALAKRVPTAKADLDKLGISLAKNNIGGQTWVDTMNAVAQASAALGEDAGAKLREFVERGKQFQRFQINPQEMIGTGVNFNELSEALAKSMKVGVAQARQALFEGRVKLADGAAALRAAVEKKFSGLNLRQMMSFDNILKKLGETFDSFTKDIDLEPLLAGIKDVLGVFDQTTVSGQALKSIVGDFGKGLVGALSAGVPLAKQLMYGLIIGALRIEIGYLKVRNALRATFGGDALKGVDLMGFALKAGETAAYGVAAAVVAVGAVLAAAAAQVGAVYAAFVGLQEIGTKIGETIKSTFLNGGWKKIGTAIVDGLVDGLKSGAGRLVSSVQDLGTSVKDSFKNVLGIHSPSKVFADFGKNTTEGFSQGVDKGSDRAQASVNAMVSTPDPARPSGASKPSAAPVTINLTINVSGGDAKQAAAALSSGSLLDDITKAIVDAVHGAGVPVPH